MAKKHPVRNLLVTVVLLVLGLSALQYYEQGFITWHRQPLAALEQLAARLESLLDQRGEAPFVYERSEAADPSPALNAARAETGPALEQDYIEPGRARFELVGQVTQVIDGDSIEVQVNGTDFTVRLFGIDTPEHDQPHGDTAARALTRELDHRKVVVTIQDIDSYGRLVGTVYHRGENINRTMIAEGHGWWYRQYARSEDGLREAEESARDAGRGLWGAASPLPPWEWRQRN